MCLGTVVRRLNDLYKSSVMSCRSLNARLERFFSRKHRLMDHINTITAERLLFSHTVQMVGFSAAFALSHVPFIFLFVCYTYLSEHFVCILLKSELCICVAV